MTLPRREFLRAGAFAGSVLILPRGLRAQAGRPAANARLQIAMIGVGGRGQAALSALQDEQIVAFCDVDHARARGETVANKKKGMTNLFERFKGAAWFHDWRVMFERMADQIDAVVVTVPDHMHHAIGMEALRRKKHLYVEKPLCRCVTEVRALHAAARAAGVVTQMGNQGRAAEGLRLAREWVQAGVIGQVRAVHAWTSHNHGLYSHEPYGNDAETDAPPATLDYDLWQGVAPARPYLKRRNHSVWRGYADYGCGALGDWGCHQLDAANFALDLGAPTAIEAAGTEAKAGTFPAANTVTYRFPARGARPPVEVRWFDGGLFPPDPVPGFKFDRAGGSIFHGDKGIMWVQSHSAGARLLPEAWMQERRGALPPKSIPRVAGGPHKEWVDAIRAGKRCGSDFDYSAPLAETALLGVAAVRARARLEWDAKAMRFTNNAAANTLLGPGYAYRAGWGV